MVRLQTYSKDWNLKVNLSESDVFRNGGNLGKNDKWWYKGERLMK